MFHFFSKKEFLVDSLEGFIDIHNHILPGIDDGAQTADESIDLIRGMGEFGVRDFICTPHIMNNYHPNTPETIQNSFTQLKAKLAQKGMDAISVRTAAEHMIDDNFESILEKGDIVPFDNNYLLIEMSYLQPSLSFDEAVSQIFSKGYFPILAHPERYIYLHNSSKKYMEYKEQEIRFQLNLLSLGEYYGKSVRKMALKLLENGMIDFIGSDIHTISQVNYLKEIRISTKVIDLLEPIMQKTNMSF